MPDAQISPAKAKIGRPSIRTEDNAQRICELLAEGKSLVAIAQIDDLPGYSAIMDWVSEDPSFAERYARARDLQTEREMDALTALADEPPREVVGEDGVARVDAAWVTWQKNRIETRKWIASKLKPKKYGDAAAQTTVNVGVVVGQRESLEELRERMAKRSLGPVVEVQALTDSEPKGEA